MTQKILYVFAHPDDETFTCGGTIAHNTTLGFHQILYCATQGDRGKTGNPPVCTPEALGETRKHELTRAAQILGIDQIILHDFGDGTLHQQPLERFVQDLVKYLELEQPDIIITFPPSGISGHMDHQVISKATLQAVEQTTFPTKLYYIVIPESIAQNLSYQIHATPDEWVSKVIDVTPYLEKIGRALQEHKTQHLSIERVFPGVKEGNFEQIRNKEYFQLVMQR
ncbi:PIG-L deacetylase family protein [Hazenella coriacea]|uniref:LmbE family N-acetylglucosaminyl deacetylase n=1 Tax=Hazenella coriacea TaxID=1179467 RepID=A0A4R3L5J6_9BACL|nr:PIG-L deacetylase family protein [Hazenella coriacea]TCS93424.1 LmbE family N-acetylglucosaminyl deacetylase [Hazenella coriacea]